MGLPDDLVEQLKDKPNLSAYVADALRRRVAADDVRARLRSVGYDITDEQVAQARADFQEERALTRANPDLRLAAAKLYAEAAAGREAPVTEILMVLDTTALVAYTRRTTEMVGTRVAGANDLRGKVIVPSTCLAQAYVEADPARSHMLDVISGLTNVVVINP